MLYKTGPLGLHQQQTDASLAKANGARLEIDATLGEGTVVALVFPKDRVARSAKPGDQAATSSN